MTNEALISKAWQVRLLVGAVLVCLASVAALAWLALRLQRDDEERLRAAIERAADQAGQITEGIASRLEAIVPAVDTLAADVESGSLAREAVPARLERDFLDYRRPDLLEMGIAYAAASTDSQDAPHYGIKDETQQHFQLEDSYDYLGEDWYLSAIDGRSYWSEPYFGVATGSWAAGYTRAFHRDGRLAGVARANFSLSDIHRLVTDNSATGMRLVGNTAYAMLLSAGGRIIAHPHEALIGKSAAELERSDPILVTISRLRDGGQSSFEDHNTGEIYWIFAKQLSPADWTAAVVFNQREILAGGGALALHELAILAAVLALLSLGVIVLRAYRGTERAIWRLALYSSLVFSAAIVVIWTLTLRGAARPHGEDIPVADHTAVEALLDARGVPTDALQVPTGVFVQSLRFTSANNVLLTGYVWQRAPGPEPPPGVILPEAEELTITPIREGLWYFETTLRQQFDYSRYPFDREDVWIRLWPGKLGHFTKKVVLTPDFDGYTAHRPIDKPGLEGEFVLEGWQITDSHFSFRENRYNASFGFGPQFDGERSLELYFNIGLKRDFLSPFIADFIPIIVVAFLVFKVLMSSTRRESSIGLFGFSASAVLGYCAALFFVLIVSHIHLRETLQSSGIIYIEWFYFAMYFAVLAVSTNALVFASDTRAPLVHFRDNVLVKQAFWPLLTALLLVVTVTVFH